MNEAIEIAIKTEKDGIEFYSKAAEKTKDELGKKMFLSLVEDEKRHLAFLEKLSCEEDVCLDDLAFVDPKKELATIFSEVSDVSNVVSDKASDREALDVALEMERKGYKHYKQMAEDYDDTKMKRLFEQLAYEEERHYEILDETRSYLDDTGRWFMWDEYSFPQG
jgi:rubrerythrin